MDALKELKTDPEVPFWICRHRFRHTDRKIDIKITSLEPGDKLQMGYRSIMRTDE